MASRPNRAKSSQTVRRKKEAVDFGLKRRLVDPCCWVLFLFLFLLAWAGVHFGRRDPHRLLLPKLYIDGPCGEDDPASSPRRHHAYQEPHTSIVQSVDRGAAHGVGPPAARAAGPRSNGSNGRQIVCLCAGERHHVCDQGLGLARDDAPASVESAYAPHLPAAGPVHTILNLRDRSPIASLTRCLPHVRRNRAAGRIVWFKPGPQQRKAPHDEQLGREQQPQGGEEWAAAACGHASAR